MKLKGRRQSKNIVDRRQSGAGRAATAGGVGGLGLIAIVVIGALLGVDVSSFISGNAQISSGSDTAITQADEEAAQFTSQVLGITEEIWADIFQ